MISRRLVTKNANTIRAQECLVRAGQALHTNTVIDLGRACKKVGEEPPTEELNAVSAAWEQVESALEALHDKGNELCEKHDIIVPGPGDPEPLPIEPLIGPAK